MRVKMYRARGVDALMSEMRRVPGVRADVMLEELEDGVACADDKTPSLEKTLEKAGVIPWRGGVDVARRPLPEKSMARREPVARLIVVEMVTVI